MPLYLIIHFLNTWPIEFIRSLVFVFGNIQKDLSLMSLLLSLNVAFLFRRENWFAFILFIQMKGEKELVEKILQTEISIFRAIRDGSALMQHMEDFYYITLLEVQVILILIFYYGFLIIISMCLFNYSIICHCFGCKLNWVSEPFFIFVPECEI